MAENGAGGRCQERGRPEWAQPGSMEPDADSAEQLDETDHEHDLPVEAIAFEHGELCFEHFLLPARELH